MKRYLVKETATYAERSEQIIRYYGKYNSRMRECGWHGADTFAASRGYTTRSAAEKLLSAILTSESDPNWNSVFEVVEIEAK